MNIFTFLHMLKKGTGHRKGANSVRIKANDLGYEITLARVECQDQM